jgi:hypothetical protein
MGETQILNDADITTTWMRAHDGKGRAFALNADPDSTDPDGKDADGTDSDSGDSDSDSDSTDS